MKNGMMASILSAAAIVGTAALLMADSSRKCIHPPQSIRYQVGGDCGAAGEVTISSALDACEVVLEGDQRIGLPERGSLTTSYDLEQAGYDLSGDVAVPNAAPSDAGVEASDGGLRSASRTCRFLEPGVLRLTCDTPGADPQGLSPTAPACSATLTKLP